MALSVLKGEPPRVSVLPGLLSPANVSERV